MTIYLSGAAIAELKACSLMAVNKAMRRGRFGKLLHHGRSKYAALPAIEAQIGRHLDDEQIAAAVAGNPKRRLIINSENQHG